MKQNKVRTVSTPVLIRETHGQHSLRQPAVEEQHRRPRIGDKGCAAGAKRAPLPGCEVTRANGRQAELHAVRTRTTQVTNEGTYPHMGYLPTMCGYLPKVGHLPTT